MSDSAPSPSRFATAVVVAVAALVLAGTLWRVAVAVPRDAQLNHVSGIWTAMAMDLADGVFYRPVMGDDGYGGTRYFPLHVALQAILMKAGADPVRAGYPIAFLSALALVAGVYAFLRRFGLGRALSGGIALLALSTTVVQQAVTTVRGDLLPAALNVWGIVFALRWMKPGGRRRDEVCAAVLFALAFMAKETTLFGLAAAVGAFWLAGRRREAARLLGMTLGLMVLLFGVVCLLSGGRIVENLLACAGGGITWASVAQAPRMTYWILMRDPLGMAFLTLGFGAWLGSSRGVWKSLPALWMVLTLGATLLIVMSPGVSANHFVDVQAAAIAFFAIRTAQAKEWAAAGACTLALAALLSLGAALMVLRGQDLQPQREQLREVYASIRAKGKPILSEDPALLVENRVRPVMLDPFCFRVARAKRPELFDRLREELENRRFGAVVLRSDPRTADGQAWLRDMNFGPGFAESVLRSYEFSAEKYGCLIFLPRSAGP